MSQLRSISSLALAWVFLAGVYAAPAQQSFYRRFRAHNTALKEVEPTWMAPLIQTDARIGQGIKLSVSNSNFPPVQPTIYGGNHGFSIVIDRRFQLDFDPPSFFRNHSSAHPDGFGNIGTQVKMRLISGNAQHGNFVVSAVLFHGFGARAAQNQFLSAYYVPSIAAGKAFGRFALISNLGGLLPTAKIQQQGRAVEWNFTGQVHAASNVWFDVENNAAFFYAGPADHQTQNMITPAAFYLVRRRDWSPEHASLVFDCGMQIATSHMHFYNHNLVTEMRVVF